MNWFKTEAKIKDLFEQMKELEVDLKKWAKKDFKFLRKEKRNYT